MSAHSKKAWLALGLSLTAGTAYAAIPDANGVIRGCYSVLSGSARIVDGNSCGFLERAISWQQTGPQGPAGAPGPQGPVGPQGAAGDSNLLFGRGSLGLLNPVAPQRSVEGYVANQTITPPSDGFCALTISGTQLEFTGSSVFFGIVRREDGQKRLLNQLGILLPQERESGSDFDSHASGTAMDTFEVEAGHSYEIGVNLGTEPVALTQSRPVAFALSWLCKFED